MSLILFQKLVEIVVLCIRKCFCCDIQPNYILGKINYLNFHVFYKILEYKV